MALASSYGERLVEARARDAARCGDVLELDPLAEGFLYGVEPTVSSGLHGSFDVEEFLMALRDAVHFAD